MPAGIPAILDRHLFRATEDADLLSRYLTLLKFARRSAVMVAAVVIIGLFLLGAGVTVVIMIAGLSPRTAIAIGSAGTVVGLSTPFMIVRSWFGRKPGIDRQRDKPPRAESDTADDQNPGH